MANNRRTIQAFDVVFDDIHYAIHVDVFYENDNSRMYYTFYVALPPAHPLTVASEDELHAVLAGISVRTWHDITYRHDNVFGFDTMHPNCKTVSVDDIRIWASEVAEQCHAHI